MIELLRKKQTLLAKTLAQKPTRPLNISIGHHSDIQTFNISPYAETNGYVTAIRVQDIARNLWFNWDRGAGWSPSTPKVTVGTGTLYVAAWVMNGGEEGELHLVIKNDQMMAFADKRQVVAAGGSFGAESGTINMPNRTYGIIIMVTP